MIFQYLLDILYIGLSLFTWRLPNFRRTIKQSLNHKWSPQKEWTSMIHRYPLCNRECRSYNLSNWIFRKKEKTFASCVIIKMWMPWVRKIRKEHRLFYLCVYLVKFKNTIKTVITKNISINLFYYIIKTSWS